MDWNKLGHIFLDNTFVEPKIVMELKRKCIWVTFEKEGIHCYPDAPDEVAFLRHPHRHMFHFRVEVEVFHDDRDLEFILLKRDLMLLYSDSVLTLDNKSCEMIATDLFKYINEWYPGRNVSIEVSEDGENGARLEWSNK